VQGHPYPKRGLGGPAFRKEGLLEGEGGGEGICWTREDGEEAVAFAATLDHLAPVLLDASGQKNVVASEGEGHGVGVLLPEAGVALDVREQERDRAGR
jgi:hypothetical protein